MFPGVTSAGQICICVNDLNFTNAFFSPYGVSVQLHTLGDPSVYSCIHWVTPQCSAEECSNNFRYSFKPNVPAYEPTPVVIPAPSLLCVFAEN